jgi:hypothetical protein
MELCLGKEDLWRARRKLPLACVVARSGGGVGMEGAREEERDDGDWDAVSPGMRPCGGVAAFCSNCCSSCWSCYSSICCCKMQMGEALQRLLEIV